jgi:flagellin-like protein
MYLKKGISAIVAVILMILITVAAVVLVYQGIFPMLKDLGIHSSKNSISIVTQGGYTLYDEQQKIACVQVMRETPEEIQGLKILFSVEGNSHAGQVNKEDLPGLNQKRTYCFDLKNFGKPDTVTIFTLPEGKGIAITSIIPTKELSSSGLTIVSNLDSGGGLRYLDNEWIVLDECAVLSEKGAKYKLKKNLSLEDSNLFSTGSSLIPTNFCFVINQEDITLDLSGRFIKGNSLGGGIYAGNGIKGTTIMNGGLDSLTYGLILEGVNDSSIEDLQVSRTDKNGVFLRRSYGNSFENILVNTTYSVSSDGFEINESNFNTFEDLQIFNTRDECIEIEGGSNNTLRNILVNGARGNGIKVSGTWPSNALGNSFEDIEIVNSFNNGFEGDSIFHNTFTNLNLINSGGDGVRLYASDRNNFTNLRVLGSGDESVDLDTSASYNRFESFYLTDKKVKVHSSSYNQFINGVINGSSSGCEDSYCSFYLNSGGSNTVRNVTFFDNRDSTTYTFYFLKQDASHNYFSNLTLCGYSARYHCPDKVIYELYGPSNSYQACKSVAGWNLASTTVCP